MTPVPCERCGRERRHHSRGLCRPCYDQWKREQKAARKGAEFLKAINHAPLAAERRPDPPHRAWDGFTMRHFLSAETEARLVEWERRAAR